MNSKEKKIPKIIHYCWFGGNEMPLELQNYRQSWKKFMPDYAIMEWNENNFNIANACEYVRQAYKTGKWAFVSDYVRTRALYEYGGIYLDTDMEVLRSLDEFLGYNNVFGFEVKDCITACFFMCRKHSEYMHEMMKIYERIQFLRSDGSPNTDLTIVLILTRLLRRRGIKLNGKKQRIDGAVIFPREYFNPNNIVNIFGKYKKMNYMYHHAEASWHEARSLQGMPRRMKKYLVVEMRNTFGTNKVKNSKMRRLYSFFKK